MNYYRYLPDADAYAGVEFADSVNELVTKLLWSPTVNPQWWKRFRGRPVFGLGRKRVMPAGDFWGFTPYSGLPVCNERAWAAIGSLIDDSAEALPIEILGHGPHFVVNVFAVVAALDETKSRFSRRAEDGSIYNIRDYVFDVPAIAGRHIFRLPLLSGAELIVDDVFRKAVDHAGLKGLLFRPAGGMLTSK